MSRPAWVTLILAACLVLSLGACSSHFESVRAGANDRCIADFDPATDYFPDKSSLTDATNFVIDYHSNYQVLTVRRPYPNGSPVSYVLVRCGTPAPKLTGRLAQAQRITVPVKSLYSASITHLGMIDELGQADVVRGVANTAIVVSPRIRQRIDAGTVVEYAAGQQINVEAVVSGQPDVVVTQGTADPGYVKLQNAGIGVLADAEWLEATPLGRAEWIKVFAALTGTERIAGEVYGRLRDDYTALAERTVGLRAVLPGEMYQGTWSMPTGHSYAGRLITDAGGTYPWAGGNSHETLQLSFESVFAQAGQAPLWLVNTDWKTLNAALAQDNRYGELTAVRDGRVWSATKAIAPTGGNDYWERGVVRPDLVLGDLVAILHPDLLPDHPFAFYRRVPRA